MSSAHTSLEYDRFGRMVMRIEHELVRGLSPDMVAWWFRNIEGEVEIDGRRLDRYLAWHPYDHIRWELRNRLPGGVGVGSRFRIVEAFGADPRNYIDIVDTVTRLDETGITLVNRDFGVEITRLSHDFTAVPGGTLYRSTLIVGTSVPMLRRVLNPLLHRVAFTEEMGRAWLKHNVEEVGLLEHFVPLLRQMLERPAPATGPGV